MYYVAAALSTWVQSFYVNVKGKTDKENKL